VTSSESSDVARLNEARIKALTGRDPITARGLYQSEFTYWPVAKFWLAANHKPKVHDDSEGFWRRVHLIPFTQSFIGRQDNTLKDRLRAEAPGILAWLVRGCLAWQRDGLRAPVEVRQATEDYRRESETLAAFYEAVCIVGADQQVGASELFSAYQAWSGRMGLKPREQLTLKAFGRDIRKRFNAVEKHNRVTYYGVGLRPAGEVEEEHAAEMRPSRMGRPS
jgi:putative DNA primase/helicase